MIEKVVRGRDVLDWLSTGFREEFDISYLAPFVQNV